MKKNGTPHNISVRKQTLNIWKAILKIVLSNFNYLAFYLLITIQHHLTTNFVSPDV